MKKAYKIGKIENVYVSLDNNYAMIQYATTMLQCNYWCLQTK